MAMYPNMASRMYTPARVLKCETVNKKGMVSKVYTPEDTGRFIAFSNFQGTEKIIDGVLVVENTAVICSPYIKGLQVSDRIRLEDSGSEWDIITPPENWNMQNLFLIFKVRRVESGA